MLLATPDARIQRSLKSIEGTFINAIDRGPEALTSFLHQFSLLQQQIVAAQSTSSLSAETITLAHTLARDVLIIGKCFLDIETAASGFQSRLVSQTHSILKGEISEHKDAPNVEGSGLDHTDPSPYLQTCRTPKPSLQPIRHPTNIPITSSLVNIFPSCNSTSTTSVTESTSEPNSLPEFIEHAYKFFVANIFNPYPTRQEKQSIVDKTNNSDVTLATISNWFTNARRRCGWTDILKQLCDGNRDEMVGLATRIFVKSDPRHPVDPHVISEFMDMKNTIESMYGRKTRTSAWIDELKGMEELINPIPLEEQLAAQKRETEAEREACKRQRDLLKEQRDFEKRKQKMQAEALRKAEKVVKQMRCEQEQEMRREGRASNTPAEQVDEEPITETLPAAGGKRKHSLDVGCSYDFSAPRHVSPASSLSSGFDTDLSSDSRVPSLSWSESSEERPYKRIRSSSFTVHNQTSLAPALEVPGSFEYSFTFEPPTDTHAVFNSLFDFPNTGESSVATPQVPPRGQKRQSDTEDGEETPRPKRAKPIVASGGPELAPVPATPLFTPTPSVDGTPMSRHPSLAPIDLEAFLGLDRTSPMQVETAQQSPQPVQDPQQEQNLQLSQNAQQDVPLPFEIDFGSFDWPMHPDPTVDPLGTSGEYTPADFAQLLQSVTEQLPLPQFEPHGQFEQRLDYQPEVSSLDWLASDASLQPTAPADKPVSEPEENLAGLMSGLMSEQAFNDLGLAYPQVTYPTLPDLSHSSSGTPAWTPPPTTPSSEAVPTPAELAQKALSKERRRKELEEKKAALERERARLAEIERELEDE